MEPVVQPERPTAHPASAWRIAAPLLAAVLVMMTFLTIPPAALDLNVDADTSWCAVLNYAHQHGLQFGTDLVFTYGPLGYLITFYFSPNGTAARMVADVALCWTVAAGLCLVAWRLRPVWRCLLLGVFVFVVANIPLRTDLVIDAGFLCWGLLCFVESGRRLAFSVLTFTALAVFGALAKTTYLFMAGLSVVLLAGGLVARGHWRLALAMLTGIVVGLPLVWMAAGQNLWHLGSYFVTALAIVQGYNQAMGWEGLIPSRAKGAPGGGGGVRDGYYPLLDRLRRTGPTRHRASGACCLRGSLRCSSCFGNMGLCGGIPIMSCTSSAFSRSWRWPCGSCPVRGGPPGFGPAD